jgi:hypothetical protein
MSLPTGTTSFPLGFETVTISTVTYKVDAVDLSTETTRIINRTDENGDASDYQIRASGEKITGTMTLQRADRTVDLPASGTSFSYDFDQSGTPSTLVVTDTKTTRSKDSADIFEIGVLLDTYQG